MKYLLWLLKWMLKAAIFFTLFAFALNNQQDATVHFFFGNQWRAPLVLVVLTAFFAMGVVVGVLGMVPRWWKQRRLATTENNAVRATARRPAAPPSPPIAHRPHGI
jgi:putative membrane protein